MPLPIMWYVKGKDYLCKEQLVFFFWLQSFLALINWSGRFVLCHNLKTLSETSATKETN